MKYYELQHKIVKLIKSDCQAILIAGPTASGKSKLALQIASTYGGEIINTDSMQVYHQLYILTARPSLKDMSILPHHLYGHVNIKDSYSVVCWLKQAKQKIEEIHKRGKLPVFTGGSGLYFYALTNGLAKIPEIPKLVRNYWRDFAQNSPAELHQKLKKIDPVAYKKIHPSDTQRLVRALEVFQATQKSITHWHQQASTSGIVKLSKSVALILSPPREVLWENINKRFDEMLHKGAVNEVQSLLDIKINPSSPAMKALGITQIARALRKEIDITEASSMAKTATRQYAKRQETWFRNRFKNGWLRLYS